MGVKKRRVAVYIGRFQPFHKGHLRVVKYALKNYDNLIIVIGSYFVGDEDRTLKNPWTGAERHLMIVSNLSTSERARTFTLFQEDCPGRDEDWVQSIRRSVESLHFDNSPHEHVLIGTDKDDSTYYLKGLFPFWKKDLLETVGSRCDGECGADPGSMRRTLNATDVRRLFFANAHTFDARWQKGLPKGTIGYLSAWRQLFPASEPGKRIQRSLIWAQRMKQ